ncbi:MAG: DUF89 family protein [Deltaproteobacteria bacterium]|nr:MAG: DUF89 family protein [Deltaproteobacteria bacterium]
MIRVEPECYPCFLNQVLLACREGGAPREVTEELLRETGRVVSELSGSEVPARVATGLHRLIKERTGNEDPFRQVKERALSGFRSLRETVRRRVFQSGDPLREALFLAGAGNMFDHGIVSREDAERFFEEVSSTSLGRFDVEKVRDSIERAWRVGLLLDNAGEAPFDAVLAEVLRAMGKEVWLGVKGAPVIDDLTLEDAGRVGLTEEFEVISNGSDGVGTLLEEVSPDFAGKFRESDLIISKGQANFETLYGDVERTCFLFVVKCPVIERATGYGYGKILLLGEESCAREGESLTSGGYRGGNP